MNLPDHSASAEMLLEAYIRDAGERAYMLGASGNEVAWKQHMQLAMALKGLRAPGVVVRLDAERMERARQC